MTRCQGDVVSSNWIDLLEAVETKLTVKAGEVVCLDGVNMVRGEGVWRQDVRLDKMSINDKAQNVIFIRINAEIRQSKGTFS